MELRILLVSVLVAFLILGNAEGRKKSGGSRGGGGSRTGSRTTQRPRSSPTQSHGGSNPSKIGWNVPEANNKPSGGGTAPKPSAPLPDQNYASKTSATSLQSGAPGYNNGQSAGQPYNPSYNQPYNPPVGGQHYNQPYNPPGGQSYNPPVGQSYNPSAGHPYNPSAGQSYNPSAGHPYNPPVGQPYNPPVGQPYNPPVGQPYNPPVAQPQQIIVVPGQSAQPSRGGGLGDTLKQAVVFAGVNAGVNAAVNRIFPGSSGHSSGQGSGNGEGGGGGTQITYNYYNNGTSGQESPSNAPQNSSPNPANPAGVTSPVASANPSVPPTVDAQGNPVVNPNPGATASPNDPTSSVPVPTNGPASSVPEPNPAAGNAAYNPAVANPNVGGNPVRDEDIQKLSEDLSSKDANNATKHITMNLQGQKTDGSSTDDAPAALLTVSSEAFETPTIAAVRALYDNYEFNAKVGEDVTADERKEETNLLDAFLSTEVMKTAMKFLVDKGFLQDDEFEFKDALRRIWFSQFKRAEGEASSSGFENVFLAEEIDGLIGGLHNWIYFSDQETTKRLNYLGYIKQEAIGQDAAIIKLRASLNDIVIPVTTIFVGTSPELEMALYTVCFYTRPNNVCPVSLGGTKFIIFANRVNYFGKDILISAYPEI